MGYHRRHFLKTLGTGLAATALSDKLFALSPYLDRKSHITPGLQLYTLRADLPKDVRGVLKQVSAMGYKEIEGFEAGKGIFWGMTNKEFKRYMDDLGMRFISSHCDINNHFEEKADQAAAIGMKYLIAPYLGPQKQMDDYKRAAEKFNQKGEVCRKAGLKFAYHNHDYSFVPVNGQFPQDIMMQNTDRNLVDFEMDIYWVVTAGQDPIEWMRKYRGRFRLCHVKDRKKDTPLTVKDASCTLGLGDIDFKKILHEGKKYGLQHFIVEQEKYDNTTPLEAAKEDADYLKAVRV
jgi:sugar phosphate isomerase/epimerase